MSKLIFYATKKAMETAVYLFIVYLLILQESFGRKVRTIYLSTNSPHMHASPPSIKWDEFTVLLNAKGSHA